MKKINYKWYFGGIPLASLAAHLKRHKAQIEDVAASLCECSFILHQLDIVLVRVVNPIFLEETGLTLVPLRNEAHGIQLQRFPLKILD
jgi:hypothetical protein